MKVFNQKLPKTVKVIVNISIVLALLIAIIGLNVLVQKSSNSQKTANQRDRLNVAIVNEDKTITEKDKRYNLGADYIKTIERDDSQNWTVASRSTAEAGLKKGDYQLAIYIPSDFSSKILDLDSVVADKAIVTYKVNAKGNARVETAANAVGRDVVSDLNNQLVNMYLASVLGNLYIAQQNAQLVSDIQSENISDYSGNLLASTLIFPNNFPTIVSWSNSSLSANASLTKQLNTSAENANNLDSLVSEDLRKLATDYGQGDISAEDYTSSLLSTDPESLSTQINSLSKVLEYQSEMASLVNNDNASQMDRQGSTDKENPDNEDDGSPQTDDEALKNEAGPESKQNTDSYKELTDKLKAQLKEIRDKLLPLIESNNSKQQDIEALVKKELSEYYGKDLDKLDSITVADLLGRGDSGLSTHLEQYKSAINRMISTSVSALPSDKVADLLSDLGGVTGTDYSSKITQYSDSNPASSYNYTTGNTDLQTRLHNAAESVRSYNTDAVNATAKINTKVSASLQVSGNITVDSWWVIVDGQASEQVSPSQTLDVDLSKNNEFHYNIATAAAEAGGQNQDDNAGNGAQPSSGTIQVNLGGVTSTEAKAFDLADYRSKVETYAAVAQETVDAYNNAGNLLSLYHPNGSKENLTDTFFNQSAKTLLTNLLTQAITGTLGPTNEEATKALKELDKTQEQLVSNMGSIQGNNDNLKKAIDEMLVEIQGGRQDGTTDPEREQSEKDKGDELRKSSDLPSKLSKLISQSESLKSSAISNAKAASSVSSSFESFNKAAKEAEADSKKMSAEAQELMVKFNKELAQSNDFVKSFVDVLKNAYDHGVPNEALLEFLSSPVAARTSSYQSRVNTYRPFTWVLLLAVISLFTAYLFATQDLIQRVKNKFVKGLLADTDALNVGALSVLALTEGLILGIVSSRAMALDRDLMPSWILLFVLFSFLLLHSQYFLLTHMKALGMGLSLYSLVSFIYFSNAVGATVATADLAQKLKKWNILTLMETKLTLYFDNITAEAGLILGLLAGIVIVIVLNTIVRFPWEKHSYIESK